VNPATPPAAASCIASSIPGRLRLRHAVLRKADRLTRLQLLVADWPQVREIQVNPAAGSLLIHYDADALPEAECRQRCEAALAGLLPQATQAPAQVAANTVAAPAAHAPRTRSPRARAKRANQMAKRGMMVSLAASMILGAIGAKKWHIWTGIAFLHALGVHMWVYRHSLLK